MSRRASTTGGVDWVPIGDQRSVPIIYSVRGEIVQAFAQYALSVAASKSRASDQAFKTSLDDVGHHLGAFQGFLDRQNMTWQCVSDKHLKLFRDNTLASIQVKSTCRSELAAKRTANRYLRTTYRFFLWAQEEAKLLHGVLGWPKAPIRTLLARKHVEPQGKFPGNFLYPLCFERCGQGSRHTFQYVATPADIDRLLGHFFDDHGLAAAERNALIVAVIDNVGWRQGSVIPLNTQQFDDSALAHARAHGYAWVTPALQKFGYENCFEVPLALVERVRQYIAGSRLRILESAGISEVQAKHRLFLNVVSGEPLAPRSVSQILSRAFRKIGAPVGAGAHSLRRKFSDDRIDVEIAVRKRENRSTDPVNVGAVLQRALGQSSIRSQEAYARAISRATWDTVERRQHDRIKALEHENAKLRVVAAEKMASTTAGAKDV